MNAASDGDGASTFVIIWRYRVQPENVVAFGRMYAVADPLT